MSAAPRPRKLRLAGPTRIALGLGFLYGVLLMVAALTAPFAEQQTASTSSSVSAQGSVRVVSPVVRTVHQTAVQRDGIKVLFLVGSPLLALLAVAAELRWCRRWGHPGPGGFTVLVVLLLVPLSVLGALSIGPFVLPLVAVVVGAAASEYGDRQRLLPPPPPAPPWSPGRPVRSAG